MLAKEAYAGEWAGVDERQATGALVGASDDSARCTDGSANGFNPPPSMSSIGTTLYDMVAAAAEDARPQWKRE